MIIKEEPKNYIDNEVQLGFYCDYNKALKYLQELDIPENVWTPSHIDFNSANWFTLLSKRSRGKTTNILLFGLILYQMYGGQIVYARLKDDELRPTFILHMFSVISQYHYISKITNDRWNTYYYHAKHFYLANEDDEGKIIEIDKKAFMMCLPINLSDEVKSTLNLPDCVLFLYDEFMKHSYNTFDDEFMNLCQCISTVRRDRIGNFKVLMVSNLVSPDNKYLEEMDIREALQDMTEGENKVVTAEKGAKIYIEVIAPTNTVKKKKMSVLIEKMSRETSLFFGFHNNRLKSITGGGWEVSNYPHLTRSEEDEKRTTIFRDIYIKYYEKVICLEICESNILGFYINARPYFSTLSKEVITFTLSTPKSPLEYYGWGSPNNKICKIVWGLYQQNRFYYSSNEVGRIVNEFVQAYKSDKKLLR